MHPIQVINYDGPLLLYLINAQLITSLWPSSLADLITNSMSAGHDARSCLVVDVIRPSMICNIKYAYKQ